MYSPVISRSRKRVRRQLALRLDFVGRRLVECGLRLLHVGHGDQADLEALLGLLQLAR
jgi:hypothetical protein